jgi:O-antigen/teichoic acid export membrane protein
MGSIQRNVTYSILVQVPTQIFGIIVGIFITRMLGPAGKGLYAIFYADVTLFVTLLDFSIINSIIYFSASKKTDHAKLMAISLIFIFITLISSLTVVLGWIQTPFARFLFSVENFTWQYVGFFLLFLIISHVNTIYPAFFKGAKNFKIVNRVLLLNSIFTLLLYAGAFILHLQQIISVGLNEVLIIGLIILFINTFFWHIYFRKHFKYAFDFKLKWEQDIKPFFRFMGFGHLATIIGFLNYRLVLYLLAYFLDEEEVGYFTIASGVGQMLYFITTPLSQVLMPYLSAETDTNRLNVFQRFARMHFALMTAMVLIAILILPYVIPLVYGSKFSKISCSI